MLASPEEILKSSPHVWFKDVLDGYDYLVDQGYEEIAVAGLSRWCIRIEIELKSFCKGYCNYVCTR